MSQSQIMRIPSGFINRVNDAAPGQQTAPPFGPGWGAGQVGQWFDFDASNVRYDPTAGNIYFGRAQYIKLAAASLVPVVGQLLFLDTTVDPALFQMTTDITLSSVDTAVMVGGVNLTPNVTPGNYTLIQIPGNGGEVDMHLIATLTVSGAIGLNLLASQNGGADLGFVDTYTTSATASPQQRKVGVAIGLPVGGALVKARMVDAFGS
jgi:hypothetical protein